MSDNKVTLDQLDNSAVKAMTSSVGDVSMLNTENKTIVGAISEIVGKKEIANAIGEPLAETDKFTEMSSEINGLLSTFKTNMMNAGVVVESGDKFKALIDKIRGLTEGEGNKGIQFAEGVYQITDRVILNSNTPSILLTDDIGFSPTYVFACIPELYLSATGKRTYNVIISNTCSVYYEGRTDMKLSLQISENALSLILSEYISSVSFQINTICDIHWYALGIGEEDTTLRDSLADILENKGVDVTEEDDMATLIGKVDSIRVIDNSIFIVPGSSITLLNERTNVSDTPNDVYYTIDLPDMPILGLSLDFSLYYGGSLSDIPFTCKVTIERNGDIIDTIVNKTVTLQAHDYPRETFNLNFYKVKHGDILHIHQSETKYGKIYIQNVTVSYTESQVQ